MLTGMPPSIRLVAIQSSSDPLHVDLIVEGDRLDDLPPGAEAPFLPDGDPVAAWPT
jgi:hypothetical protein